MTRVLSCEISEAIYEMRRSLRNNIVQSDISAILVGLSNICHFVLKGGGCMSISRSTSLKIRYRIDVFKINMASTKTTPRDAIVMASILKDMGIIEYEPRVINQMLEFTYRYITNILEDARVFSSHAKKKTVDVDDVKLAIQMQMDRSFTTPPPRDILIDIARHRNNVPLPLIKPHSGLRLPPDRYCLSACNYHMKVAKKLPARQHSTFSSIATPKINFTSIPKSNPAAKSGPTLSLVGKGLAPPTVTVVTRPSTAPNSGSLSVGGSGSAATNKSSSSFSSMAIPGSGTSSPSISISSSLPKIQTKLVSASSTDKPPSFKADTSNKRKREDDDYDA